MVSDTPDAALTDKEMQASIIERTAQLAAHRACVGTEHNPDKGKLHGCCVVCGVPWPCEYAGTPELNRAMLAAEKGKNNANV